MARSGTNTASDAANTAIAKSILRRLRKMDSKTARTRVSKTTRKTGRTDPSLNRVAAKKGVSKNASGAPDTKRNWQPNHEYKVTNKDTGTVATYKTDSKGRVTEVEARLTQKPGGRNQQQQSWAGGGDRKQADPTKSWDKDSDAGGHWIAQEHGGSREGINYTAQNTDLNSNGNWRKMEEEFGDEMSKGNTVDVKMTAQYSGNSERPDSYAVKADITNPDGTTSTKHYFIRNQADG